MNHDLLAHYQTMNSFVASFSEGVGLLFLVSGPAGSGKTTLCTSLLKIAPQTSRAITCTSRSPRPGEQNGIDYFFLKNQEFEASIANNEFFEYALVHNFLYGLRKKDVFALIDQKRDVLLIVDVQGAATIRDAASKNSALRNKLVSIFVQPSSIDELRERLLRRSQDKLDEIECRLRTAAMEIARSSEFDYILLSKTKEEDINQFICIYVAERLRYRPNSRP